MNKRSNRPGRKVTNVEILEPDGRNKDLPSTVNQLDYDLYIDVVLSFFMTFMYFIK